MCIRDRLKRVTDAGSIDGAGSDSADGGRDIEQRQRVGIGVHHPRDATEQAADQNDGTWSEPIDEITFDRHQPGLREDENGERDLDGCARPAIFDRYRIDDCLLYTSPKPTRLLSISYAVL